MVYVNGTLDPTLGVSRQSLLVMRRSIRITDTVYSIGRTLSISNYMFQISQYCQNGNIIHPGNNEMLLNNDRHGCSDRSLQTKHFDDLYSKFSNYSKYTAL